MTSLSSRSAELALKHLHEMPLSPEEGELVPKILSLLELIAYKFASCHSALLHYFFHRMATLSDFTSESTLSLGNTFTLIFRNSSEATKGELVKLVLEWLDRIVSVQLLTTIFNALSLHLTKPEQIEHTILRIKEVIGELPLVQKGEDGEEQLRKDKAGLRYLLITDSIFGGVFGRALGKLLYKLRQGKSFNRLAAPILLVLCSLLRHYQSNLCFVDQAVV